MVRLELIAYQRVINSAALSRARVIGTPKKWNPVNPMTHTRKLAHAFHKQSYFGRLIAPIVNLYMRFQVNQATEVLHQQGIAPEDKFLHSDSELRRDVLWEYVAREQLHPYEWLLKIRRRERYFKVQRTCRGFHVPEYIRKEAASRTWSDLQNLQIQWWQFTYQNYVSEMTPTAYKSIVPKLFPLELIINIGILRPDAWNRYFFNETDPGWLTQKELEPLSDPKRFPFNLTTADGKKEFEAHVLKLSEERPGWYVPKGEKFDFKAYYAKIGV